MSEPQKISIDNGKLRVPDNPIIPFIEGDGTGPDIWRASVRVFDAAVAKAYGGTRESYREEAPQHTLTLLAFEIARTGHVLFEREPGRFHEFQARASLRYADTAKLRAAQRRAILVFLQQAGLA